jgi:hypothetical protein
MMTMNGEEIRVWKKALLTCPKVFASICVEGMMKIENLARI